MSASSPPNSPHHDPRDCLIDELQRQLDCAGAAVHGWATLAADLDIFSSGIAALDRLLPGGGLRHGMLVEWLGERAVEEQRSSGVEQGPKSYSSTPLPHYSTTPLLHYSSAVTLSLLAAREACRQGGMLVVIDQEQIFYPPAAAAWGINLARLIVVHPRTARDALWAAVQSLRSPVVAAMWTTIDRLDSRAFRRLQLAAQAGRTLGLLVRPAKVRGQPSWADVQLWTECPLSVVRRPSSFHHRPQTTDHGRHAQIRILRSRGARPGGRVILEIDDAAHSVQEVPMTHDAHPLPVVTELADPAAAAVSARA